MAFLYMHQAFIRMNHLAMHRVVQFSENSERITVLVPALQIKIALARSRFVPLAFYFFLPSGGVFGNVHKYVFNGHLLCD